jgi:hypothetical protein
MTTKLIAIAAILAAVVMLAGTVATNPMTAVYADESETESELKCKGTANVSGQSSAANFISCQIGDVLLGP